MGRITWTLTVAALLLAACHSYRPLPLPATAVGRTVRVQFSVPRNLVAVRGAVGDSVLERVSTFRGRVTAVSRDTMSISLLRITDAAQDHDAPAGLTVTVGPEPSVAVDVLEIDGARTTLLAAAPLYVITTVALLRALERFFDSLGPIL